MLDKLHYRLYNCIIRKLNKPYGGKDNERKNLYLYSNNLWKIQGAQD